MRMMMLFASVFMTLAVPVLAADDPVSIPVTIKDHHFVPDRVSVPANSRFQLVVSNQDNAAEELECPALKKEKVIPAGKSLTVPVAALKAGEYRCVGEYHEDSAKLLLVAE